ncbi:hypothetical protein WA026_018903 [Henosepilachna vigintioctopunctata]|uniref:OCIA domain-containing protein n=1 Tax=Henosepilachna vigintioctopunctata TaxID=420089 RepID=A0AAW1UHB9_9CUCU
MLDRTDESLKPPSARNREQIKFTLEEIKVIKDCNRESFFKRCIPISTILGLGTYYGVKSGYFKPNPKLGATPKVIGAVILGYFIGKVSYQTKCAERIMQLPNSPLGEILRQRRRGQLQESGHAGFGSSISLAPYGNIGSSDTVSDIDTRPSHSFDLDSQRPQFEGLDESFRPSIDNPIYEEEMPPIQKHVTTYEELRKQNREDYQQKRIGNVRDSSTPRPSPVYQRTSSSTNENSSARNKYGDEME